DHSYQVFIIIDKSMQTETKLCPLNIQRPHHPPVKGTESRSQGTPNNPSNVGKEMNNQQKRCATDEVSTNAFNTKNKYGLGSDEFKKLKKEILSLVGSIVERIKHDPYKLNIFAERTEQIKNKLFEGYPNEPSDDTKFAMGI
ncbi:hypothetical protein M8C21_032454, partial [Ambrosia artemisiifolia]